MLLCCVKVWIKFGFYTNFQSCYCCIDRKRSLGISSYGVSVTTMEEVFIQVGKDEDEEIQKKYVLQPIAP